MTKFKITQEKTLGQCKLLSESQTTKYAELIKNIGILTSQIVVLKNENGILRNNINDLL